MTDIKHKGKRNVLPECKLIFESEFKLLSHAAQDLGEIPDKLGKVKETSFGIRLNFPTFLRMVLACHGSLVILR